MLVYIYGDTHTHTYIYAQNMLKKDKTVSKILRTKLTSTMTFAVTEDTVSAKIKEYHQFKILRAVKYML